MAALPDSFDDALSALEEFRSAGNVKDRREVLEAFVARWPSTPESRAIEAELARRRARGRAALAVRSYASAVSRAKAETQARVRYVDRLRGGLQEARAEAPRVGSADAARCLARAHNQRDEPFAALEFAKRAAELARSAASLTFLAARHRAVGDHSAALAVYREAWTLPDRDERIIRTGAAAVEADLGRLQLARSLLRPVLEAAPGNAFALNTLGRIQRLLGEFDEALTSLATAIRDRRHANAAAGELRKLREQACAEDRHDLAASVDAILRARVD